MEGFTKLTEISSPKTHTKLTLKVQVKLDSYIYNLIFQIYQEKRQIPQAEIINRKKEKYKECKIVTKKYLVSLHSTVTIVYDV